MEINQIPILRSNDLQAEYKNASISDIIKDKPFVKIAKQKFHKFNLLLYIHDNGDVFIIKNRFGRDSKEYLEYLLRQNEILTDRYINAEKFILNLSNKKWWQIFNLRKKCRKYIQSIIKIHGDKKS
jgi:hypothetical protein